MFKLLDAAYVHVRNTLVDLQLFTTVSKALCSLALIQMYPAKRSLQFTETSLVVSIFLIGEDSNLIKLFIKLHRCPSW